MSAEFHFDVDPSRDLVRIRMSGFFTPEDISAFLAARDQAHSRLTCAANQHLTINDLRGMKIQSQEAVDKFGEVLSERRHRSKRLAFVIGKTLARTQLSRIASSRDAQCFDDLPSAEAWLFGRDHETAAA